MDLTMPMVPLMTIFTKSPSWKAAAVVFIIFVFMSCYYLLPYRRNKDESFYLQYTIAEILLGKR